MSDLHEVHNDTSLNQTTDESTAISPANNKDIAKYITNHVLDKIAHNETDFGNKTINDLTSIAQASPELLNIALNKIITNALQYNPSNAESIKTLYDTLQHDNIHTNTQESQTVSADNTIVAPPRKTSGLLNEQQLKAILNDKYIPHTTTASLKDKYTAPDTALTETQRANALLAQAPHAESLLQLVSSNDKIANTFQFNILHNAVERLDNIIDVDDATVQDAQQFLAHIKDSTIPLGPKEAVLEGIYTDAVNNFDPVNHPEKTFYHHIRDSIENHMLFAQQPMAEFYNSHINHNNIVHKNVMTYKPKEHVDDFTHEFNQNLIKTADEKTAPWLNTTNFPYYTQDAFSRELFRNANQLNCLMFGANNGYPFINFEPAHTQLSNAAPVFNINNNTYYSGKAPKPPKEPKEKKPPKIIWTQCCFDGMKTNPETGKMQATYKLNVPAKYLKHNPVIENPTQQPAIPNVGFNYQSPYTVQNGFPPNQNQMQNNFQNDLQNHILKYMQDYMANYFNCALTKTPFMAPPWTGNHTEQLDKQLYQNPIAGLKMANQMDAQATKIMLPDQTINHNIAYTNTLNSDPALKDAMLNTLSSLYFNSKNEAKTLPSFMQYMDDIARSPGVNSPVTPNNIKDRMNMMLNVPALQNDMISTFVNHSLNQERAQTQQAGHKGGRS